MRHFLSNFNYGGKRPPSNFLMDLICYRGLLPVVIIGETGKIGVSHRRTKNLCIMR